MDKAALVENDIATGRTIAEHLKKAGVPVRVAFWFWEPEPLEWRLRVVTPLVDSAGPLAAYSAIQSALGSLEHGSRIPIYRFTVMSPKDPMAREVRKLMRDYPDEPGFRLTHKPVAGAYIEDAYVYRLP